MKAGGFDFTRIHPIEFYAVFPDEVNARRAATRWNEPRARIGLGSS